MTPVRVHLYEADRTARRDHRGFLPCVHCPLPRRNQVHTLPDPPDTSEAQAEHLRRIGEDDDL